MIRPHRWRACLGPVLATLTILCGASACAHGGPFASVQDELELDRVVLYRNGIGYFERTGQVSGNELNLRVRRDQVDDLLKSLTVVDGQGRAVGVAMPQDPDHWAQTALAALRPGSQALARALTAMRGVDVALVTANQRLVGRIVLVEPILNEPDPDAVGFGRLTPAPMPEQRDARITLMDGRRMQVVRLSKVRQIELREGEIAMQMHRRLDAVAGEGMFQQLEIRVQLEGSRRHDLRVSYVVDAPLWKPSYRVVLGDGSDSLLQGWAVVDNLSGEDWDDVELALTSGTPIAFRYGLHAPRHVQRPDMSHQGNARQARVEKGHSSWAEVPEMAEPEVMEEAYAEEMDDMAPSRARESKRKSSSAPGGLYELDGDASVGIGGLGLKGTGRGGGGTSFNEAAAAPPPASAPAMDVESLNRSVGAQSKARTVRGQTRIELQDRVDVPDGSSTMVAFLNEKVRASEAFMYRPGGSGAGFEKNPYRSVRFENATPYALEPGPIAIYAEGGFVGEGLLEPVGAGSSATIPFAVEPSIEVTYGSSQKAGKMRLVKLVRGVLEVESWQERHTKWTVKSSGSEREPLVLVRQDRPGQQWELQDEPEGTEEVDGAWLIPVQLKKGEREKSLEVVQRTPSRQSLAIWDGRVPALFDTLLATGELDAKTRAKLEPIADKRQEIGRIDTEIQGLQRQQAELDRRANQTRQNLIAIKGDARGSALRAKLNKRLEEFTEEGNAIGRKIVELNSRRLEVKIELEDMLEGLELGLEG